MHNWPNVGTGLNERRCNAGAVIEVTKRGDQLHFCTLLIKGAISFDIEVLTTISEW